VDGRNLGLSVGTRGVKVICASWRGIGELGGNKRREHGDKKIDEREMKDKTGPEVTEKRGGKIKNGKTEGGPSLQFSYSRCTFKVTFLPHHFECPNKRTVLLLFRRFSMFRRDT